MEGIAEALTPRDRKGISASSESLNFLQKIYETLFRGTVDFLKSRIVVSHSPLVYSFMIILFSKALQKRIVVFVWDHYPVTIDGTRFNPRLRRRFLDALENATLRMADLIIVPTMDFLCVPSLKEAIVLPMWYSLPSYALMRTDVSQPLKLAFAGQINRTRGLNQALQHLDRILTTPIEVHIFSRDTLPDQIFSNLQVFHYTSIEKSLLSQKLRECDFGLISLHPLLDGPGFPSKTYDYLQASLPVLYFGKPLPAFEELIVDCEIGQSITTLERFDPKEFLDKRENFFECRADFYARTLLRTKNL